ncbi:MAG: KTSC domain-containing protein [Nanoarchaeota archaeon]
MKFIKVESSNLEKIGYDIDKKVLAVQFDSGRVYNYSNVPQEVVLNLLFAESIGKYFNANIREKYTFEEVKENE